MKEPYFWEAAGIHYLSISAAAIFNDPFMTTVSLITFALIPSLTKTKMMVGLKESTEAQLETLKTQRWLNKKGYYENLQ